MHTQKVEVLEFFERKIPEMIRLGAARFPSEVVLSFVLEGHGGGAWQVCRKGRRIQVGPVDDRPKDCEMRCSSKVFWEMMSGHLSPQRAFFEGRLHLQGDIGLALRLHDMGACQDFFMIEGQGIQV